MGSRKDLQMVMSFTSTVLGCTLFCSSVAVAQGPTVRDPSLRDALDRYLLATQRGDVPALLEQVHPTFFEFMPKALMQEALESALNDPEHSVSIDTVIVLTDKGPVFEKGTRFHYIVYENHMRMKASAKSGDDGNVPDQGDYDVLLGTMRMVYGVDNVQADPERREYLITTTNSMFAILDPAIADWRFIGYKPEMKGLLDEVLPTKVRKRLGAN